MKLSLQSFSQLDSPPFLTATSTRHVDSPSRREPHRSLRPSCCVRPTPWSSMGLQPRLQSVGRQSQPSRLKRQGATIGVEPLLGGRWQLLCEVPLPSDKSIRSTTIWSRRWMSHWVPIELLSAPAKTKERDLDTPERHEAGRRCK